MIKSVSENTKYPTVCYNAATNESHFINFKQNTDYTPILEHVSYEDGLRYINHFILNKLIMDNIDKFKINDTQGNPHTYNYNIGRFSPTTLRYIIVLSDLSQLELNNKRITEIGAGYGGQYCILRQLYTPALYTFIDLPEVLPLIKKYIEGVGLNDIPINYINAHDVQDIESDLVISNYAISECSEIAQTNYIYKIINKSKHGYIIYNNMLGYNHTDFISKSSVKIKILQEDPNTNPSSRLLVW